MKIGLISHWYDPEGGAAAGPGIIARALRDRGHEVHVVTGFPIYPQGSIFEGYAQRPYFREELDGITVHRAPIFPSHDSRPGRRMANYLSFAASGCATAQAVLGSADVTLVYSTPATAALPALALRALRRVPFVVHIQDLWPDTVVSSDFVGGKASRTMEKALHMYCDLVYRAAHTIAVTSPGMAELIASRGISSTKLNFVPNWAEESSFYPRSASPQLTAELGPMPEFSVMYAGNLGEMQGLMTVVDAAEILRDEPAIGFVLVGAGTSESDLRNNVAERGLSNVKFIAPQPFSRMAEVLALGDVQLVTLKDRPLFRATLPSKLQANLAAGKPIIASVAGDAASVVEQSGAGLVSAPGDPVALAAAVRRLHSEGGEAIERRGTMARRYYDDHFSSSVIGDRLEALLIDAAGAQFCE